jgi:hypothetical protein
MKGKERRGEIKSDERMQLQRMPVLSCVFL